MTQKLKRIKKALNAAQAMALAVAGLFFFMVFLLSGEPTSTEGEKLQFPLLFGALAASFLFFGVVILLGLCKHCKWIANLEKADFERRAAKIRANFQNDIAWHRCLVSLGSEPEEVLLQIELDEEKALRHLAKEYFFSELEGEDA